MLKTISFFLFICFSSSAFANQSQAVNFINDLANRSINLIKNQNLSDKEKESQLTDIFLSSVDTKWIGRFAMGRYWRTISPQQQNQYLNLYTKYLVGIYVPNFRSYTGNVVKVIGSKQIGENEYIVQTQLVNPRNTSDIKIDYRIIQQQGYEKFLIFDIIAEGVSLITTQRAEVNSVMSQGGFKNLIDKLSEKTSN